MSLSWRLRVKTTVKKFLSAALPVALLSFSHSVFALTLTFDEDSIGHGTIINNQYSEQGVNIRASNLSRGPDLAVAYDTSPRRAHRRSNRDPDLTGNWGHGNALIIQENRRCNSLTCFRPDDEGSRPAGSLFFDFDTVISQFSFDFIDIERPELTGAEVRYRDSHENLVGSISFADLSGAVFGNNSYNSSGNILLSGLDVRSLEFYVGGSGALDNIHVSTVPLPASVSIFALGLAGLHLFRRRIQKAGSPIANS